MFQTDTTWKFYISCVVFSTPKIVRSVNAKSASGFDLGLQYFDRKQNIRPKVALCTSLIPPENCLKPWHGSYYIHHHWQWRMTPGIFVEKNKDDFNNILIGCKKRQITPRNNNPRSTHNGLRKFVCNNWSFALMHWLWNICPTVRQLVKEWVPPGLVKNFLMRSKDGTCRTDVSADGESPANSFWGWFLCFWLVLIRWLAHSSSYNSFLLVLF